MSARFGTRQRWWLLAFGWAVLLVLGVTGFVRQADELGLDTSFLDHLYFTLQLAVLNYKGPTDDVNWQLEIVRFTAPLMSAGTLLQSASVVFREQFARWRAGRASGHTVVVGLGPVGTRLVEALAADGREVVAIRGTGSAADVATLARHDVPVVDGDPADPATLRAARVDRAERIVAAAGDDITNVAVAAAVRDLPRADGLAPLRCAVRLEDGDLAHLLRSTELHAGGGLRLEFFNVHERAAHALLAQHPVDGAVGEPHLVVMGVGQFGGEIILAAAQSWAAERRTPLQITMVDRRATGRYHALRMRHPALDGAVDATTIDLDLGQPTPDAVADFDAAMADRAPSLVVVAFDDDTLAWSSALFAQRRLGRAIEVVVRTDADSGFGDHLRSAAGDATAVGGIAAFPFLDRACTTALIEGGVREQLAHALHEEFLRDADDGHPLRRPWEQLPESARESNRSAADGIVSRLAEIGIRLAPLRSWTASDETLTADDVERLAAAEHSRWRDERHAQGWVWAAVRDDAARQNPLLVDWSEVPDEARATNRRAAAALPALLARAGFELVRDDS